MILKVTGCRMDLCECASVCVCVCVYTYVCSQILALNEQAV